MFSPQQQIHLRRTELCQMQRLPIPWFHSHELTTESLFTEEQSSGLLEPVGRGTANNSLCGFQMELREKFGQV